MAVRQVWRGIGGISFGNCVRFLLGQFGIQSMVMNAGNKKGQFGIQLFFVECRDLKRVHASGYLGRTRRCGTILLAFRINIFEYLFARVNA